MENKHSDTDIVFGIRPVMETILAGKDVERVLVQKDLRNPVISELLKTCVEHHIPFAQVPVEKLNRITRKNHQGVIGLVSAVVYASLDNIISDIYSQGKNPLLLMLDRITDVRNFGAIARTAACAGVNAIIVPEKGGARIGSDAFKTSAGALSVIPVCREANLKNTIKYLKDNGLQVIACTEKARGNIYEIAMDAPSVIIMGSEEDGISPEYLKLADHAAHIPMLGQIGSLNVSVAAGVILYEAIRQRKAKF